MVRVVVVLAVVYSVGGCATLASRHKDEAPKVLQEYQAELLPLRTAQFVEAAPPFAWNLVIERLRRVIPVESADFESRVIQTHWHYGQPRERQGLAAQKRERFRVALRGNDAASYGVQVQAVAEIRQRTTCSPPGPWIEAAAEARPVGEALDTVLKSIGEVPLERLEFPGTPGELLPVLSEVMTKRYGLAPMPEGLKFPVRGSWRERAFDRPELRVEVRSTVLVAAQASDTATRLLVDAKLQHRGVNKEGATLWVDADPEAVRRDFFARLVQVIRPNTLVRPTVEPVAVSDPEPPEVELPRPADPLQGTYGLFVRAVIAPRKKPNGLDWDPGEMTQTIIKNLRGIATVAALVPEPHVKAVALAVKKVPQERYEQLAELVGQFTAPDIQVRLAIVTAHA
ncbi:MAG: hypothetical protein MUF54_07750 [Polyangiaceae bacterium]|jgi:hypothetical protein|nr:hypothetical protein [Polyangiaceae bacterium]